MELQELGYNEELEEYRREHDLEGFAVGRVVSEHRERYVIRTGRDELHAEILGNLRYSAASRSDLPSVGDWVAFRQYDDDRAIIHAVFPRKSILERKAPGSFGEKQVLASNIDAALLVQAVDRDFSINRLERYLAICHASGIRPVIVLSKTDLVGPSVLAGLLESLQTRIPSVPVIPISNLTRAGYAEFGSRLEKGKTYCLLGSSGAGKSTLLNAMAGRDLMHTGAISQKTGRGRHVTTRRELFLLDDGGMIIDNPGLREVGITESEEGILQTFAAILEESSRCRYRDCTHTREAGCAVRDAVDRGLIDRKTYENYLKMEKEKEYFESSLAERRKRDREFGKMVKRYKKDRKTGKF